MTLPEKALRREQIAFYLRNGGDPDYAAEFHGLTSMYIRSIARSESIDVKNKTACRRLNAIGALRQGRTIQEVVSEFKYTETYLRSLAIRNEIHLPRKPRTHSAKLLEYWKNRKNPMWDIVDWTLQDIAISKMLGVTRERVRQVRKKLGKPQARFHHRKRAAIAAE